MDLNFADGYGVVCRSWADAWRPRTPVGVAQWAETHRLVSDKESRMPGPWRNDIVPYGLAIMAALGPEHPAPIVVFKKSAQVAATQIGCNWIGWTISEDPTNMLLLAPTSSTARKFVRTKLHPMFDATPVLAKLQLTGRKSDQSMQIKEFPRGFLFVGSLGIADDLAMTSVGRLMVDEVDRMPVALEDEGDQIEIALRRGATYVGRFKAFLNSTPTTEEGSRLEPYWLNSTQDRFYLPCPHCGTMQHLVWDNLKWLAGRPKTAEYMCEECAAMIAESHKTDMLAAGEWRARFPERESEVKGFHINCLYTPPGLGDTWAMNAAAFESARGRPEKLKVFTQTRLGEVTKSPKEKLSWEAIWERREPFKFRTIPVGVLLLTAGVDVQRDRLETQIAGWSRDERATVIDYLIVPGDPTDDEVWTKLDDYLALAITNSFGIPMRISATAIDAGYLQHDVLNFVRTRKARNIFATKGMPQVSRQIIGRPAHVDIKFRGRVWKHGAELWPIGVPNAKTTLFERLRNDAKLLPADRHFRFSEDLSQEYFHQLTAERYDPKTGKWVETAERNEALDTLLGAMAAAMHPAVRVNMMRESDWQRLEQLYEPKDSVRVVEPVLGAAPVPRRGGGFLPTVATVRNPE